MAKKTKEVEEIGTRTQGGRNDVYTGTSFQGTEAWADKDGNKYTSEWWKG